MVGNPEDKISHNMAHKSFACYKSRKQMGSYTVPVKETLYEQGGGENIRLHKPGQPSWLIGSKNKSRMNSFEYLLSLIQVPAKSVA